MKLRTWKTTGAVVLSAAIAISAMGVSPVSQAASSVRLNKTSVSIKVGKSVKLKVKGTKAKVKWSSSDKTVATVSNNGKVDGIAEGKAVIRAKVLKKTLKCKVTVVAEPVKPLSTYWTAGSDVSKQVIDYVTRVTDLNGKDYIPVEDRIAVFDMDGTLTCETYFTYFDTMMFIDFCLKDHPERVSEELKEAARAIKPGYKAGEELARNFAKAYAGMTIKELYDYAVQFGQKYTDSFNNMRYLDGFYLPMVELVEYLYYNDFTIYVVSGTERTTSRAIVANSPIAEYVSPAHVIGTEFEVKVKGHENEASNMDFKYVDGDELVYSGGFVQKNLNANKSIDIEREIGQYPVFAFGNSFSDSSMMNYALDKRNPYPSVAFMLINDDTEREWGPDNWDEKSAQSIGMNYTPVSMKNDFAQIYKEGITKAATQVAA